MDKIDDELISRLERLARIRIHKNEREKLKTDLNRIVEMFDKLQEVDTRGVEPIRHMNEFNDSMREDQPASMLSAEEALSNVANKSDNYIQVPNFLKLK